MKIISFLFMLFFGVESSSAESIVANQDHTACDLTDVGDGSGDSLSVRGNPSTKYAQKIWIKFDLSSISYNSDASAALSVTYTGSTGNHKVKFFARALNSGFVPSGSVLGTGWLEGDLDWANAPGNDTNNYYTFSADTTAIGSWDNLDQSMTITNGQVLTFNVVRIGDFVQSDGSVTLMMSAYDAAAGVVYTFASSENSTFAGPTLFIDTEAPSIPTVNVSDVSTTSSRISWNASTDDVGIEHYKVYRDDVCIATTNATMVYDSGLDKHHSYEYKVEAYDTSGNVSTSGIAQYGYSRFPFFIPLNAGASGVIDMSGWLTSAATNYVTASGGDLYVNGSPIRFLGVNLSGQACFPSHTVAGVFTDHLAKMGVNCVRFSAFDRLEPYGIFDDLSETNSGYMIDFDSAQLEKFDYFVSCLKDKGIYVDLILHMNRNYPGMPTTGVQNYFKGVDNYYPELISRQKEFATDLLTHTNAYTGFAYKDDPVVAFIEINNENGLIHEWCRGRIGDDLDSSYITELEGQWQAWLSDKYTYTKTLKEAWLPSAGYDFGTELVENGDFSSGTGSWTIQVVSPASASCSVQSGESPDGGNALEVDVSDAGSYGWHVQFYQTGIHLVENIPYTVSFWAKAETERDVTAKLQMSASPYTAYGDAADFVIGTDWNEYKFVIVPSVSDPNPRFNITNLGLETGKVWFANCSVKEGNTMQSSATAAIEQLSSSEKVSNGYFASGVSPWSIFITSPAAGSYEVEQDAGPNSEDVLHVDITAADTNDAWLARFYQLESSVTADQPYILSFWAKADSVRTIRAGLYSSSSPWNISETKSVVLGTEWKHHRVVVCPDVTESDVRIYFTDLAAKTGSLRFTGISLTTGIKSLKTGETLWGMNIFDLDEFGTRTRAAQKDWGRFLWETEKDYYTDMRDYVKNTLGAHGLIIGSQTYFSPALIQSEMDVVDTHFYVGHPVNSGDPTNWYFSNYSMAGRNGFNFAMRNAPLSNADKPFVCTEYNHPNPNTYGGETYLLASAYASLQKWDAVFAFNFSAFASTTPYEYFHHFYSICQEPVKLVSFPAAAAMFRRGDIDRSSPVWGVSLSVEDVIDKIIQNGVEGVGADDFGFDAAHSLQFPLAIRSGNQTQFMSPLETVPSVVTSDSGEHVWNSSNGLVYVKAPKSKAVIGSAGQQEHDLGDGVSVTTAATMQPGDWAALSLMLKEGGSFVSSGARFLVTATGYTDNTHMVWKDGMGPEAYVTSGDPSSVGEDWGKPSVLVEGITATIALRGVSAEDVQVWSLDEEGGQVSSVSVSDSSGSAVFTINKSFKTLWYEVVVSD